MKPVTLFGILIGLGAANACTEPAPTATVPVFEGSAMAIAANGRATASLSGSEEVPAVDTRARGTAVFQVSKDGSELLYQLNVANISNVLQAHIHLALPGANGPVVAFLFDLLPPPEGRVNGVLAKDTIWADRLVGPLAGQSIADLVALMSAGNTYVNVHTIDNPPGEIRGQIR